MVRKETMCVSRGKRKWKLMPGKGLPGTRNMGIDDGVTQDR